MNRCRCKPPERTRARDVFAGEIKPNAGCRVKQAADVSRTAGSGFHVELF